MLLYESWNVCSHVLGHFFRKWKPLALWGLKHVDKNAPNQLCKSRASQKNRERQPCTTGGLRVCRVFSPTKHYTRWLHWLVPAVGFKQQKSSGKRAYYLASVALGCLQYPVMFRPADCVLWDMLDFILVSVTALFHLFCCVMEALSLWNIMREHFAPREHLVGKHALRLPRVIAACILQIHR